MDYKERIKKAKEYAYKQMVNGLQNIGFVYGKEGVFITKK